MVKILVFEPKQEKRASLEQSIRNHLDACGTRHVEFEYFTPEDVFCQTIPKSSQAAFFTVGSMYDGEAARKFGRMNRDIPLVIVSDSEEYALEAWRFGTAYYLQRPYKDDEIDFALEKCALSGPRRRAAL